MEYYIDAPISNKNIILNLKTGDRVYLSGLIYMARDAAHKKIIEIINNGEKLPFDIKGSFIYYAGPCPPKPGCVIGSCGPTTSGRMDAYTPLLLSMGLAGMIGKGLRSDEVKESIVKNKAVYFAATGGAGALLSQKIKKYTIKAFSELGPEALAELEIDLFPLIVAIDSSGRDIYRR